MINLERFTQRAQEALMEAQKLVIDNNQQELDTVHLHLALVAQEDGLIPRMLKGMDVDVDAYIADLKIRQQGGFSRAGPPCYEYVFIAVFHEI